MKKLLAKFKVGSVVNFGNENIEANLSAVVADSEENKTFSKYTPSASVKMHITNPDALDFFLPSKEYVATFELSETAGYHMLWDNSKELKEFLVSKEVEYVLYNQSIYVPSNIDIFMLGASYGRWQWNNKPVQG